MNKYVKDFYEHWRCLWGKPLLGSREQDGKTVSHTEMHYTLHVQSSKIAVSPSDEKFDTKSDLAQEFSSSTFGGIASQSDTAH